MNSAELKLPQRESIWLKIPVINRIASRILHGKYVTPGGENDDRFLYWGPGGKQDAIFSPDKPLGLQKTHAISDVEEREQLIAANDGKLTALQQNVEAEEQADKKERTRNERRLSVRSLAFIALGIAFIFTPLNRIPGEISRVVSAWSDETTTQRNTNKGQEWAYNSLSGSLDVFDSPQGNGLLNQFEYYKSHPDNPHAQQFGYEAQGFKNALRTIIKQDFEAMKGVVDFETLASYASYVKGKQEELKTFVEYFKYTYEKSGQKKDAAYWKAFEAKLAEFLK